MSTLLSRRASLLLASTALIQGSSCSANHGGTALNLDKLPPYEEPSKTLFDDSIDPAAFGLNMSASEGSPSDASFRERIRLADVISSIRVTTVTISKVDEKATYTLQFEPIRGFLGTFEEDLRELVVSERAPQMYSVISSVQARAKGRTLIGFWRRFREQNRMTIHYRFFSDSEEITKALQDSLALEDLKK